MKASVLIVDDDAAILKILKAKLERDGLSVETARTGYGALEMVGLKRYSLLFLDLNMPSLDGAETLKRIRLIDQRAPAVMLISCPGEIDKAMSSGAYDYLIKPFKDDELRRVVEKILLAEGLFFRSSEDYRFENVIIGKSRDMREVFRLIQKAKDTNITVLIQGESGTGKELVASALHFSGPRRNRPFVSVSCAAMPETLLEDELFGHEKGSFTDAHTRVMGRFEQADKGTLFLDEIAEMSLALQAKLLRVVERQEFERIGGRKRIRVNVRIISATNKDLKALVKKGRFREDLYYRINTFPIYLPPLRERREDIPLLVDYLLRRLVPGKVIPDETMEVLIKYKWKGNVRELENVLKRTALLTDGDTILPHHLQDLKEKNEEQGAKGAGQGTRIVPLSEMEEEAFRNALNMTDGNISLAAKKLGVGRATFYRKANEYGIETE